MENVTKALLIAGGIMFTILIVSLLTYSFSVYKQNQEERLRMQATEELTKFNLQFTNYARDDILGYELVSLLNKVIDYNQRNSSEGIATNAAGNYYQYTPITVEISFKSDSGRVLYDLLNTQITVPAVARSGYQSEKYDDIYDNATKSNPKQMVYDSNTNNKYRLFGRKSNNKYIQSNTIHQLKDILTVIQELENKYAKNGIQNLSKSTGSIFQGKIIGYNGQPNTTSERRTWYEKGYVEGRFKTLTNLHKEIDEIRNEETIKDVIQYSEYMQFKKASFKCTEVSYDNVSNRVSKMVFKYTGDDLE